MKHEKYNLEKACFTHLTLRERTHYNELSKRDNGISKFACSVKDPFYLLGSAGHKPIPSCSVYIVCQHETMHAKAFGSGCDV